MSSIALSWQKMQEKLLVPIKSAQPGDKINQSQASGMTKNNSSGDLHFFMMKLSNIIKKS